MTAIFKRDLRAYFTSPLGYVFLGAFTLAMNFNFYYGNLESGTSIMTNQFSFMQFVMMFLIPILTMRLLSEDFKQRTDQLLLTAPVRLTDIVLGKFFAAFAMFFVAILFTLLQVVVVAMFGYPSAAIIFGNYIAIISVSATFIAIGLFISSLTENQLVSAVLAIGVLLGLYLIDVASVGVQEPILRMVFSWLSLYRRYTSFLRGVFSITDFLYYISICTVFLFLTTRVLEKKRWS